MTQSPNLKLVKNKNTVTHTRNLFFSYKVVLFEIISLDCLKMRVLKKLAALFSNCVFKNFFRENVPLKIICSVYIHIL
jgi:hypothetical protein